MFHQSSLFKNNFQQFICWIFYLQFDDNRIFHLWEKSADRTGEREWNTGNRDYADTFKVLFDLLNNKPRIKKIEKGKQAVFFPSAKCRDFLICYN